MQYAFRGHVVVLINERSASDGEAFPEGVKRNKLGTVIGTRTWGGGDRLAAQEDQGAAGDAAGAAGVSGQVVQMTHGEPGVRGRDARTPRVMLGGCGRRETGQP
jgi:tricorn protease